MRTVHETEALRPSDPVPKHHSSNPQNKSQRLRITFGKTRENGEVKEVTPPSPVIVTEDEDPNDFFFTRDGYSGRWVPNFPGDIKFTVDELALPPEELAALLQYQVDWALESATRLKREEALWNEKREAEAVVKNVVFRDYLKFAESPVDNGVEPTIESAQASHLQESNEMEVESVANGN
jgi:hypothetical protein